MVACPACGTEVPVDASQCGACRLSVGLFDAVREAAGPEGARDPAYLQTIGDLLRSVDLTSPVAPPPDDEPPKMLDRGGVRRRFNAPADRPARVPTAVEPLDRLPQLPPRADTAGLKRRFVEYQELARRVGVDVTAAAQRAQPAALVGDDVALDGAVREMFVHLSGALTTAFEQTVARRNELAQLVPTTRADVELSAIRGALEAGDLSGGYRRLDHVVEQLGQVEEEWATGRILATECDLLAETLRDLGGDPGPATGPLEEGRSQLGLGRRAAAPRLLARSAIALWSLLKPRFMEELKRQRDRLVELKGAGVDIGPAVVELRAITTELKVRNFVGTLTAYRHLRAFTARGEVPTADPALAAAVGAPPPAPSA